VDSLKLTNKSDTLEQKLKLKTAKPSSLFQVISWVVVADQDEALKFAGAVEPGFNVFLAGKKLAFKIVSCKTRDTS